MENTYKTPKKTQLWFEYFEVFVKILLSYFAEEYCVFAACSRLSKYLEVLPKFSRFYQVLLRNLCFVALVTARGSFLVHATLHSSSIFKVRILFLSPQPRWSTPVLLRWWWWVSESEHWYQLRPFHVFMRMPFLGKTEAVMWHSINRRGESSHAAVFQSCHGSMVLRLQFSQVLCKRSRSNVK